MLFLNKFFFLIFFALPVLLVGDVSRFLDPISIRPQVQKKGIIFLRKHPLQFLLQRILNPKDFSYSVKEIDSEPLTLSREILESKLGELLGYRYQASGRVVTYVTRQWKPIRLSSNFIIKIRDCMPDQLTSSTFLRFAIWDNGTCIGEFAEPVRVSHFLDCYYTKNLSSRGSKLVKRKLNGTTCRCLEATCRCGSSRDRS